ncbi:DUF3139 domain-containing protein [Bacillus sp. WMMC1349]|uniref:YfjL-like protein n=1 Tax=Bacillus sp. WMMC1349 TaxID=2736254 RepID=UPI0020A6A0DF|nr:DUF3139 domain-containing protein [Bacillus sp. WMMC1349]
MEDKVRYIIEDLLPLYHEGLLSEETSRWIEEQAEKHEEYRKLVEMSNTPLPKKEIVPPVDQEKMFKKINRKLSFYQIIFVAISFFIAMKTSLLNDSFGFILWYPVLGLLIYLFYRDIKSVLLLSFVPILLWSFMDNLEYFIKEEGVEHLSVAVVGAFFYSVMHCIFSIIGSFIGWLSIKFKKKKLYGVLIVVLSLLILYFYNAYNGNPISQKLAEKALEQYLAEQYPKKNLRIEEGLYDFKFGEYSFNVIDLEDEKRKEPYIMTVRGFFIPEVSFDDIRSAHLDEPLMKRLNKQAAKDLKTVLAEKVNKLKSVEVNMEIVKGQLKDDVKWSKRLKTDKPMGIDIVLDATKRDEKDIYDAAKTIQRLLHDEGYDYEYVMINANIFEGEDIEDKHTGYVKYHLGFDRETDLQVDDVERIE